MGDKDTGNGDIGDGCLDRRTPFVYWAQSVECITLKVDIRFAKDVVLLLENDGKFIDFTARGRTSVMDDGPFYKYNFQLPLFAAIEDSSISINPFESHVKIKLKKQRQGFWKFGLLPKEANRQANKWLKIDFEKWMEDPDDQLSDEQDEKEAKNPYLEKLLAEYEKEVKESKLNYEQYKKKMNLLLDTYLFVYNTSMFFINFFMLLLMLYRYLSIPRAEFMSSFWSMHFQGLLACTLLQYADVVHSICGLTKAKWNVSFSQVTGRLFVMLIINGSPPCSAWFPVYTLMVVYFLSEQFRYPYYALNSIGIEIYWISWLRYNAWLLLYPIGIFLEGIIFVRCIPYYYHSGTFSLQMPNILNMSFNAGVVLAIFTFTGFPTIVYILLTHMHRQRAVKTAKIRKMQNGCAKKAN